MTESVDRQTAVLRLRGADDILILCHKNPDGDTIGCAGALYLALKALGKNAAILCSDPIPKMYDYMELRWFDGSFNPAFVVAVDVASIQLFGENNNVPQYAAHTNLCMLDVIVDMGVTITPQIANCLYTGIATDTGCFKFASTTPRTHMAAARVMEAGADVEKLNARLFESRSHARITAERMAMESLEYYFDDLCAVICLTWDQIESSGVAGAELEDLTSLPRSIEGVEVGLTYRQQRDGSFRISVRTSGSIDACNIARRLGGGGHARAAGCEISGNLDNAKHAVLEEVRKELQRCGLLDQDAG